MFIFYFKMKQNWANLRAVTLLDWRTHASRLFRKNIHYLMGSTEKGIIWDGKSF